MSLTPCITSPPRSAWPVDSAKRLGPLQRRHRHAPRRARATTTTPSAFRSTDSATHSSTSANTNTHFEAHNDAFTRTPEIEGAISFPKARVWHRQALCYIALGDLETARKLLQQSLAVMRQTRAEDHPDIANAHHAYALLRLALDDLEDAETSVRAEIDSRIAGNLVDHPDYAYALGLFGRILIAQNRLDEADPALRQAIDICDSAGLGPTCWSVRRNRKRTRRMSVPSGANMMKAPRGFVVAHTALSQALSPGALPLIESHRRLKLLDD